MLQIVIKWFFFFFFFFYHLINTIFSYEFLSLSIQLFPQEINVLREISTIFEKQETKNKIAIIWDQNISLSINLAFQNFKPNPYK